MAAISRISVEGRDRRCCVSGLLIAPLRRLDFLRRPLAIRCIKGACPARARSPGPRDKGTGQVRTQRSAPRKPRRRKVPDVAKLQHPGKFVCIAKITTRKSLLVFGTSIVAGMRAAPIAVGGVSGGYGDDDRDRTFLWGKA